jgi:site-specific DNA recombinase
MLTTTQINPLLRDFVKKTEKLPLRTGKGCVIYTRVSSKEQAEGNTSLDTQKKSCEEYCEKKGYSVREYFGGTFESAKSDERKEFLRLIKYVHQNKSIEYIIVYSLDRFSRTGANAAYLSDELVKVGVKLVAVTQDVDSSTPSGKLHRNMLLAISQFDNEQRREKCIVGMVENLRQGYWVSATPFGYTNLNRKEKARNHKYVINKEGEFVKKAFELKAEGVLTNKEIVESLRNLGCKMHYKCFGDIISNPFYCGYVTNSIIRNEIYKGHHPALISEELFFKANNIRTQSPLFGIAKKFKIDELPLKSFARDEISNSPFTGYKQKGIFYYKTRDVGTRVNVQAKHLNGLFTDRLRKFEFNRKHTTLLHDSISDLINKKIANQIQEKSLIESRIIELKKKADDLEIRFIERDIDKLMFEKYSSVYKGQIASLEENLKIVEVNSSNLEKSITKGLETAEKISSQWVSSSFDDKKKLQNLVFPEGILYNKEKDIVRTERTNFLFAVIPSFLVNFGQRKIANLGLAWQNSTQVVPPRIELGSKV